MVPACKCKLIMCQFYVGTATQLVILPPHIPWIGQGGGILLLHSSMICAIGLVIFYFKWEGWEQNTFSLVKLMTIKHTAYVSVKATKSFTELLRRRQAVSRPKMKLIKISFVDLVSARNSETFVARFWTRCKTFIGLLKCTKCSHSLTHK